MDPFQDIYRKTDKPYHTPRRSRRLFRREPAPEGSPPLVASNDPGDPVGQAPANPPVPPRSNHRRRKKKHRSFWRALLSYRLNSLLIGFSLFVGGVMMLVVLSHFLRYRAEARRMGQRNAAPPAAAPAGPVTNAVPSDLAGRIAAWRQVPDTIIEVESLQQKKMTEQAEARLKTALAASPSALPLRLALARLLVENERPAEAVEHLINALDEQPADLDSRLMLAMVLKQLGEHDLSRQVAEWMIEADPYSSDAHRIAAAAFLKTDQPRAAASHLRKIVSLEFDNLDVQSELADAYSLAGDHEKAVEILEGVLQKDSSNAPAYFNLVVCYARQAMTNEAAEALNRAVAGVGTNQVNEWILKPEFDSLRGHPAFQVGKNDQ